MKKITIYSGQSCPFCIKAKDLLTKKNAQFEEIDIQSDIKLKEEMLQKSNGRKTIPQIFIDNYHVGGYDDLLNLEINGKLDDLLKA